MMNSQENSNIRAALSTTDVIEVTFLNLGIYHIPMIFLRVWLSCARNALVKKLKKSLFFLFSFFRKTQVISFMILM